MPLAIINQGFSKGRFALEFQAWLVPETPAVGRNPPLPGGATGSAEHRDRPCVHRWRLSREGAGRAEAGWHVGK